MFKFFVKLVSTVITLAIIGYVAYKYVTPKLESIKQDEQSDYIVVAVSYTHLDVYKRQGIFFITPVSCT